MKVLIDTNVILDALLARDPWASTAQELLRIVAMDKINGYIIASQTTDIFYVLCRQGADEVTAKNIIKTLTESVKLSDITPADVQIALMSDMVDYEDALLAFCAKRKKAEYIITRNEKDFQKSPVPALSPQAFLARYYS
jgi:predicted nucleic acid-binding protein